MNSLKTLAALSMTVLFSAPHLVQAQEPTSPEVMSIQDFNQYNLNIPQYLQADQSIAPYAKQSYAASSAYPGGGFYDDYLGICERYITELGFVQLEATTLVKNYGRFAEANQMLYSEIKRITHEILSYPSRPPHSLEALVQAWRMIDSLNRSFGLGLEEADMNPLPPVVQPLPRRYQVSNNKVSAADLNRSISSSKENSSLGAPTQTQKAFYNIAQDFIDIATWAYEELDQPYFMPWYNHCALRSCRGGRLQLDYYYYDKVNVVALEILQSVQDNMDLLSGKPFLMAASTAFSGASQILSNYQYSYYLQCFIADLDYFARWTRAMAGDILIDYGQQGLHPHKSYNYGWAMKRSITSSLLTNSVETLRRQTSGSPVCIQHYWKAAPGYSQYYPSRVANSQMLERMISQDPDYIYGKTPVKQEQNVNVNIHGQGNNVNVSSKTINQSTHIEKTQVVRQAIPEFPKFEYKVRKNR